MSRIKQLLTHFPGGKTTFLGALFALNILLVSGFILLVVSQNLSLQPSPPIISSTPDPSPTRTILPSHTSQSAPEAATAIFPEPTWTGMESTRTPSLTPDPSPTPTLPEKACIKDISGHHQKLPLSCEARSAVDWAAYFGVKINEDDFFTRIPTDDNPEKGFVGDVSGMWGQIPPAPYGVHAQPIARVLQDFGMKARARKGMTLDELKAEISAGRPVILWVVSHVYRGTPVPYTSRDGETTTVAQFEHTVIAIGYDGRTWTFLDGNQIYQRVESEFLRSWQVLGFMAITLEE